MTAQTVKLFLTSDEDLIHRISLQQSISTIIIDLDNDEQVSSTFQNHHIHKSILNELSTFNEINHQSKKIKLSQKNNNLICTICGDHAIGYNYDVLSCASCKAFFRRYAHQTNLICLSNTGDCSIQYGIDRKCHRCRLDRCYLMGMRRDFIIKIDNKQNNIDRNQIEKLQSIFISTMQDENAHKFQFDSTDYHSAIMSCLQSADEMILRFVKFFQQIQEFQNLNHDDQFILIKYNLFLAIPLYKCFNYRTENHYLSNEENEQTRRYNEFCRLFDEIHDVRKILLDLISSLIQLTNQDAKILSLILIILVFSQGLLVNENEPLVKDCSTIYQVQCQYTEVLWNYVLHQQLNEEQTYKYFLRLLQIIFQIQSTSRIFRDFIYSHCFQQNTVDQIAPLMQSVLRILN